MKKIVSLFIISAMLLAALTGAVSATKLIVDNFDEFNPDIWMDDSAYMWFDGVCEGYHEAIVNQTLYERVDGEDVFAESVTCPKTFTVGVDLLIEADTSDEPIAGLWTCNTYLAEQGIADERDLIEFLYDAKTSRFALVINNGDVNGDPAELDYDEASGVLGYWDDPRELGENMTSGKWINLGMKLEPGKITCYVDGKAVITSDSTLISTVGMSATPILFHNVGGHCMWDNFWIGDLNEYPDEVVTEAPVTDAPVVTEPQTTRIETEIVTEFETKMAEVTDESGNVVTDEEGNKVTEVVTEVVTRVEEHVVTNAPAPDTQKQPADNRGGAQTGDMALIVVAAMVAALGSAVLVKKVKLG